MIGIYGLYIILWGFGLTFDPRFSHHKVFALLGLALIFAGEKLLDLNWELPWEFLDKKLTDRFDTRQLVVVCMVGGLLLAIFAYVTDRIDLSNLFIMPTRWG